jgi:hypothetical protein
MGRLLILSIGSRPKTYRTEIFQSIVSPISRSLAPRFNAGWKLGEMSAEGPRRGKDRGGLQLSLKRPIQPFDFHFDPGPLRFTGAGKLSATAQDRHGWQ